MKKPVSLQHATLSLLVDMANQHIEDIETCLQDGTYCVQDNQDLGSKKAALEQAAEACRQDDVAGSDPETELLKTQASLSRQFFQELMESVETLTSIAEQYGPRTLADLMYLQNSILSGGFIDHYPDESDALRIACELPSGEQWSKYIEVEYMSSVPPEAVSEVSTV